MEASRLAVVPGEEALAQDLAERLSSGEAVPGSGWVAGVTASLAASLVAKAASRSDGWSGAEGARAQALDLRDRLLVLAGEDARAYEHALTALERRDAGLARALARAAEAPLAIAEAAADVALLAAEGAECADGSARADAAAAACLASGAATAARRLVQVNLATIGEDERLTRAERAAEAAADAAKRALAADL
jgi:formiminotetrahydrofolate cyclodeaminase